MAAKLRAARARAAAERGSLGHLGATVVTLADATYPTRLRTIADPPPALFVRGALAPEDELAVAIVGARRAGEYGRRVATDLARGLAQVGITVVSGLATGIDAAAHRARSTRVAGRSPSWRPASTRSIRRGTATWRVTSSRAARSSPSSR
jgi:DNA processing protein